MSTFKSASCSLLPLAALPLILSGVALAAPSRQESCASYAYSALRDLELANRFRECRVRSDARWQSSFQNHYGWCLTARREWVRSETKARSDHLVGCGARSNY